MDMAIGKKIALKNMRIAEPKTRESLAGQNLPQRPLDIPRSPRVLQKQRQGDNDVVSAGRDKDDNDIREKFKDVFQVKDDCSSFGDFDIENVGNDCSVAGRLNEPKYVEFFRSLGTSDYVMNTLENGHKPVLSGEVPRYDRGNNKSFYEHQDFAVAEIKNLIAQGKAELVEEKPWVVNPLGVSVEPTKKRLILDCSWLNGFVVVPSFKMEDVKTARSFFKKGGYLFTFDMKDGYHHLGIEESFRDYLGFSFVEDGKTYYARFLVAPFGLKDVPYLFTKVLRPLVSHWRRLGIEICLYLDDGFSCALTYEKALADSIHVRQDLMRAGILWSVKKSVWTPVQTVDWIGYTWDAELGLLRVKQRRIEKVRSHAEGLLGHKVCTVRSLASFVGQIISMTSVLGDLARMRTRNCQICVAAAESWEGRIFLEEVVKKEIRFWFENIEVYNSLNCFPLAEPVFLDIIEGDASGVGCGSILNHDQVAARIFSGEERTQSSTWRELVNIHFTMFSFLQHLKGRTVKFRCDSQCAVRICKIGSMKPSLQRLAEEIFGLCFQNDIKLVLEWIPRSENELADAISRMADEIDVDDWGLTKGFFDILNTRWGPITVDLFANYYNCKCKRFYSLFYSPDSLGVDAFAHSWVGEVCLMVPPLGLVPKALAHAKLCKCEVILVVPMWSSAAFWPILMNVYGDSVEDVLVVKGTKVLERGLNTNSIFGSNSFQGNVVALKLKF